MSKDLLALHNAESSSRTRLFGTSGIRGIVNHDLTLSLCHEVGQAVGTSLAPQAKVCVATDTRISREAVKEAITAGLLSTGVNVVDLGILPTPALALLTREMGFDTGIMLTASHNPPEYNGIKLFNKDATGYSQAQELEIERQYFGHKFRQGRGTLAQGHNSKERYLSFIKDKVPISRLNRQLRLVVDPGNGAASGFASYIFTQMGLNAIPLNDDPNGLFPGRNPEPKEDTLQGTIEFLRQQNADLAICFDGDADRVVFCDKEGFLGFNEMIAFISRVMVRDGGKRKVATTVETGKLLDLALEDIGGEVVRGKVGDVNLAYLTRELDAAMGVEQVGVYTFPEIGYYPDSFFATLALLSYLSRPGEIREFFQSLPPLSFQKAKIPCPNELKETVMAQLKNPSLTFSIAGKQAVINTIDGIRLECDNSWVLIRPSGTEPAIRIIAESESKSQTDELISRGTKLVQDILLSCPSTRESRHFVSSARIQESHHSIPSPSKGED
jgi:phosphoglucosamine mutase